MPIKNIDEVIGVPVVLPNYEPWRTVTVTSNVTTNVSAIVAKRKIEFDTAEYDITMFFSGANTQGSIQIVLPSGDVIDTSMQSDPTGSNTLEGTVTVEDASGVGRYMGGIAVANTSTIAAMLMETLTPAAFAASVPMPIYLNTVSTAGNRPVAFANGDKVHIRFKASLTRLAGGFNAYGAGRANGSRDGLIAPRTPQTNLTVTSAQAGFSVIRAIGVAYQDIDSNWRLKFNIGATYPVSSISVLEASISGVVFKNVSLFHQAITGHFGANLQGCKAYAQSNTGTVAVVCATAANSNGVYISGDVELNSKPSWA